VIFIYLILASQFASFTQPFAIMASLPFSLIGVFLALLLTGTTLNLFSMIGFIMLMGLVTKNAILLVDFANRAGRAGASLHDSLLQAGQVRLRPILMTTAAMIGGMMPLALGLGEGGEIQAPMGRAIIGGVVTSTLLTLVVVPVLYTYLDALHERRRARQARKPRRWRLAPPRSTPTISRNGLRRKARPSRLTPVPHRVWRELPADRRAIKPPCKRTIAGQSGTIRYIGMNIEQARFNMVEQQIRTWEVLDQRVLDLLFVVRREEFVPPAYRLLAFADLELPLGGGATMWSPKWRPACCRSSSSHRGEERARDRHGQRILRRAARGHGARVTSVEIDPLLSAEAGIKLQRVGFGGVELQVGDGSHGWGGATYDAIVLTGSTPGAARGLPCGS
jgi:hypothetical protein